MTMQYLKQGYFVEISVFLQNFINKYLSNSVGYFIATGSLKQVYF